MSTRFVPLADLLARGRPDDHPVAVRDGRVLTFADFRASVAATADKLRRACVLRCGLSADDSFAFAIGFFAALHAGAKLVLPPNAMPATLQGLAPNWDVLLSDQDLGPGSMAIVETTSPHPPPPRLDAAACRIDFFTSGSSSVPKLIPRLLSDFEAEFPMIEALWGHRVAGGCVQATVSHQHIYGLSYKILWPLTIGVPFASGMHLIWESLLPALGEGALLVSSPAHLSRLDGLDSAPAAPGLILTAGAPLSQEAAGEVSRVLHRYPDEIYGSTETGVIATRVQDGPDKPWRPFPGCETRREEDGRLALRSAWAGERGWLVMEDLVAPDGQGGFRLLGRGDRVAKIEGKRVSLPAVEQALMALPQVADAALVALTGLRDELGAILVLTAQGQDELARLGSFRFGRALQRALAGQFEPMARPRRWRFVAAIPSTGMGKRPQAALKALFGA